MEGHSSSPDDRIVFWTQFVEMHIYLYFGSQNQGVVRGDKPLMRSPEKLLHPYIISPIFFVRRNWVFYLVFIYQHGI